MAIHASAPGGGGLGGYPTNSQLPLTGPSTGSELLPLPVTSHVVQAEAVNGAHRESVIELGRIQRLLASRAEVFLEKC